MKSFFKKLLYLFSSILIYFLFNFSHNFLFEKFPKKSNKNIVFIGDSHMRFSVIPDSFSSSVNYGLSADLLIAQYWKIDELIEQNIDTIIISLGYHTFKEDNIAFFKRKDRVADELIKRYIFISEGDIFSYINFNDKLFNCFFNKIKKPKFDYEYQGRFQGLNGKMNDKAESAIWRHFSNNESYNVNSIKLIHKIIKKCQNLNTKIFFIFPPVSKDFRIKVPIELISKTENDLKTLRNSKLLIEFKTNFNDSLFFDGDHLNMQGAKKYTHLLKNNIYGMHL